MTVQYKNLPPLELLLEMFHYIGVTGDLVWKSRPQGHFPSLAACSRWNGKNAGKVAGCRSGSSGYINVAIGNSPYLAHRIVWAINGLCLPDGMEIDHINRNKKDNRIENLRIVTSSQNSFNSRAKNTNKSGVKGIHWHKRTNTWRAVVMVNGKQVYARHFKSLDEASESIKQARNRLHGKYQSTEVGGA